MISPNTFREYFRRVVPATLLAAAAAFGGSAVGSIAAAGAAPQEWDIENYVECMKGATGDPSEVIAWTRKCCLDSGGVWNDSLGKCQSPPAQPAQGPWIVPPGLATQTLEPAAPPVTRVPPGVITQTFEADAIG